MPTINDRCYGYEPAATELKSLRQDRETLDALRLAHVKLKIAFLKQRKALKAAIDEIETMRNRMVVASREDPGFDIAP